MSLPINSLYSLTWGDYGTSLVSAVQLLRCHGDLVDCTLAAGGRSFPAHKIVLCAASPYLLDLLKVRACIFNRSMYLFSDFCQLSRNKQIHYFLLSPEYSMQAPSGYAGWRECQRLGGAAGVCVPRWGLSGPFAIAISAAGRPLPEHTGPGSAEYTAQGRLHDFNSTAPLSRTPPCENRRRKQHKRKGSRRNCLKSVGRINVFVSVISNSQTTEELITTIQAGGQETVHAQVVEEIMTDQIQQDEEVTKDAISQYLPTRKRKPRAKKPIQGANGKNKHSQVYRLITTILHIRKREAFQTLARFRILTFDYKQNHKQR